MIEQTAEAMVKAVDLPGRPWTSNDGQISLTFYQVTFDKGGEEVKAEWAKKGDPPTPGEASTYEFFEKGGKQRVKLASQGGGGGSGGGGKSPDQQRSIVRQHSQEMALRWLSYTPTKPPNTIDDLAPIIDWFEADANQAAKGAGEADVSSHSPPPGPSQNGVHQRLASLLEDATGDAFQARAIADFAVDPEKGLSVAEQDAAIDALGKENMKVAAVKRLRDRAEAALGDALPSGAGQEDIPF